MTQRLKHKFFRRLCRRNPVHSGSDRRRQSRAERASRSMRRTFRKQKTRRTQQRHLPVEQTKINRFLLLLRMSPLYNNTTTSELLLTDPRRAFHLLQTPDRHSGDPFRLHPVRSHHGGTGQQLRHQSFNRLLFEQRHPDPRSAFRSTPSDTPRRPGSAHRKTTSPS